MCVRALETYKALNLIQLYCKKKLHSKTSIENFTQQSPLSSLVKNNSEKFALFLIDSKSTI